MFALMSLGLAGVMLPASIIFVGLPGVEQVKMNEKASARCFQIAFWCLVLMVIFLMAWVVLMALGR